MAETLGSLCDKLTIVKLKQWHSKKRNQLHNLNKQEKMLREEIEEFFAAALSSRIPLSRIVFLSNKVFKGKYNKTVPSGAGFGPLFSALARINCELWHVQERVYNFENIPAVQKKTLIKQLRVLNLERNECVEKIDSEFLTYVKKIKKRRI